MHNVPVNTLLKRSPLLVLVLVAVTAGAQSADPASGSTTPPSQQAQPQSSSAHGQVAKSTDAPAPNDENLTTLRSVINEVNVVFTVTDKHGRHITDLKQSDFRVVDDNKPAEEVRSFHSETNLPLQVGLLIDASNSVRDRFKFEQESAIEFLNQTVRQRYDHAFVVGFDATPEVTHDFTDDSELLAHGVHELRPGGGTALFDAIYFASRDKLMKASKATPTP